jgi:hypothetical protein
MKNSSDKFLILIAYLAALISFILLSTFITYLFNGMELSDEGYYLLCIKNPWLYNNLSTQFGFIYYYLFNLLDNDVAYLRLFNFIIIFLCSFIYYNLFFCLFFKNNLLNNKLIKNILIFIFSSFTMIIYALWIPTPNYNLLNYTGLIITTIGIFLIELSQFSRKNLKSRSLAGWGLIGIGGYLVFMAKPQSAAGLALLVLLWALISKRLTLKGLTLAVLISLGLLLASSLLLDGSVGEFIMRYKRALAIEKMSNIHSLSKLLIIAPDFIITAFWPQAFIFLAALLGWGAALAHFSDLPNKSHWLIFVTSSALAIAALLYFFQDTLSYIFAKGILLGLSPAGLVLHDRLKRISSEPARFGMALLLFAMSLVYGLGSNNPAIMGWSLSSFMIFAGFVLLAVKPGPSSIFRLAGLALTGVVILASIMAATWRQPYRQLTPLWAADISIGVPENSGKLRMPGYQAQFFESVYEIVSRAEFEPGTPVIDLTGKLPAVTYAMGGHFPNSPWLNSGYSGSLQTFRFALNSLTCVELASAWVFMYANPLPNHYSPDILAETGLEHQNHYQLVGTARLPVAVKGREFAYTELLFLKPMADWPERAQSCLKHRATGG